MPLNRAHAQEQPITDLSAREPLRDGPKDLLLPVGQRRKSFVRRCVGGGAQPHELRSRRTRCSSALYRPSYVSALAITRRGTILAGIEACAVMRSDDEGRSWSGHRRHALRDCHELHVVGDRVFEAGSGGMAVSNNDGRTWQRPRAGLDRRYGWSLAVSGEWRYLTVAPYFAAHSGDSKACVFRARGDGAWERCTDELPSLPRLRAIPHGEVFAALGDGTLLRSNDQGLHWDRVPVDLVAPSA